MTDQINFAALPPQQIAEILKGAQAALAPAQKKHRADCMGEIQAIAEKYGYTLKELFPAGKTRAAAPVVAYINPENSGESWSGRGRKPAWLKAFESAGGNITTIAA